ncbi:MAG: hypothetical protein HOO67_03760 [Candidatus Peribacteraceae bacterium]|nr:hypothetical protein [Candidatus Peribacteraceae bacterium]
MYRRAFVVPFVILLCAMPVIAVAAEVQITPALHMTQGQKDRRAESTGGAARQSVQGWGGRLRIVYRSGTDIDLDLAPLHRGGSVDPVEMVYATLPKGEWDAIIDLTASPGWSILPQEYALQFVVPPASDGVEVQSMEFLPPENTSVIRAAWKGLLQREQYLVSTPHLIRGTTLAGMPLVLLIGIVTIIAALVMIGRRKKSAAAGILVGGFFLLHLWFAVDLARFTVMHLREWSARGTLGDFGAAQDVGTALREIAVSAPKPPFVYVCTNAGNYYPKAVRYFGYPVPVSATKEDIPRATHVLVAQALRWSEQDGILTCGDLSGKATKLRAFADGSVLYSATP